MSSVSEYDRTRRFEADALGRPVPRMAGPGTAGGQNPLFVFLNGGLPEIRDCDWNLIETAPRWHVMSRRGIVAPDGETIEFLARHMAGEIRHGALMASMATVTNLTTALNRKFWAPASADPASIPAWMDMFGFDRHPSSIVDLWFEATSWTEGVDAPDEMDGLYADAHRNDLLVARSDHVRSTGDIADRYCHAVIGSESWSTIERIDPLLADRNNCDGVTVQGCVISVDKNVLTIAASGPVRVREGGVWIICGPARAEIRSGTLLSIGFDIGHSVPTLRVRATRHRNTEPDVYEVGERLSVTTPGPRGEFRKIRNPWITAGFDEPRGHRLPKDLEHVAAA